MILRHVPVVAPSCCVGPVGAAAVCAGEAGDGVAAVDQEASEETQIVQAQCDGSGEGSGVRREPGVDVGSSLQHQSHGGDAALTYGHQQRTDGVQGQTGAGVQQHLCRLCAAAGRGCVESRGPVAQRGVYVRTCLEQHSCRGVSVVLSCQVEGADAAVAEPGPTRHRHEQGHDPEHSMGL